jgi:hypothetical protein
MVRLHTDKRISHHMSKRIVSSHVISSISRIACTVAFKFHWHGHATMSQGQALTYLRYPGAERTDESKVL